MRTSKPIATISYNSEEYLKQTLTKLYDNFIISDWKYIYHEAEEDEKKGHFHVFIKPNRLVDTMELQREFVELDINNPSKPLKCIDFRSSDSDNWILYSQHFGPYLASKMESREFCYSREDFRFADEDTFDFDYHHAFYGSDWAKNNEILRLLSDGSVNPHELIDSGAVSLNMANQINAYFYMKNHYGLERNGRNNHEESEE